MRQTNTRTTQLARSIDKESLDAIALREGLRLTAYQDTGGTWTIGYGHTAGVKQGDACTQEQALAWLRADASDAQDCVSKAVKVSLTDNQYGALVSFAYNIGCKAFCSSTLVKNLNNGDYAGVPQQMLRWVRVHGVTDQGLINRRNSEGGQWVKGAYVRGAGITPDSPPSRVTALLKQFHVWLKSIGAMIAGSGIAGAQLKDAGTQLQQYGTSWHTLATLGVVLCVAGIAFEFFRKSET